MKADTAAAIAALKTEGKQELVRYLGDLMRPEEFVASFLRDPKDGGEDYTDKGEKIAEAFADMSDAVSIGGLQTVADELHAAICEGRRQDAVDILTRELPLSLMPVRAYINLFPNRIEL